MEIGEWEVLLVSSVSLLTSSLLIEVDDLFFELIMIKITNITTRKIMNAMQNKTFVFFMLGN